jgi:uncharacterized protein (DUF305 family)
MNKKTPTLHMLAGVLIGALLSTGYFLLIRVKNPQPYAPQDGAMNDMSNESVNGHDSAMGMGQAMNSMMVGLNGKSNDAFDQAFLKEMIIHHRGAVEMAQAVLKTSKRPELITLAKEIINAQTGEISKMESWQKAWFGGK